MARLVKSESFSYGSAVLKPKGIPFETGLAIQSYFKNGRKYFFVFNITDFDIEFNLELNPSGFANQKIHLLPKTYFKFDGTHFVSIRIKDQSYLLYLLDMGKYNFPALRATATGLNDVGLKCFLTQEKVKFKSEKLYEFKLIVPDGVKTIEKLEIGENKNNLKYFTIHSDLSIPEDRELLIIASAPKIDTKFDLGILGLRFIHSPEVKTCLMRGFIIKNK